jgi:hypothetical protein
MRPGGVPEGWALGADEAAPVEDAAGLLLVWGGDGGAEQEARRRTRERPATRIV